MKVVNQVLRFFLIAPYNLREGQLLIRRNPFLI
jgi:hypothetical protein